MTKAMYICRFSQTSCTNGNILTIFFLELSSSNAIIYKQTFLLFVPIYLKKNIEVKTMNHSAALAQRTYYLGQKMIFVDDVLLVIWQNNVTKEIIIRILSHYNLLGKYSVEDIFNRTVKLQQRDNART